jgi:hypothetical protein
MIQGIATFIELQVEQENGKYRELEAYELRALDQLMQNSEIRKAFGSIDNGTDASRSRIWKNGGGIIRLPEGMKPAEFRATGLFLSVDSELDYSRCGASAAETSDSGELVRSSYLISSRVECASLSNSVIFHSYAAFRVHERFEKGPFAKLHNVAMRSSNVQMRGEVIEIHASFVGTTLINDHPHLDVDLKDVFFDHQSLDYSNHPMAGRNGYYLGKFPTKASIQYRTGKVTPTRFVHADLSDGLFHPARSKTVAKPSAGRLRKDIDGTPIVQY